MTRINLRPWREERRAQQQRDFGVMMLVAVMIGAAIVVGAHMYISGLIDHQEARNRFLQNEIEKLAEIEKEIQEMELAKERLLGRLEAIQNLQRSRPVMVKLFDRMVNEIPEEVYLQSFQSRDQEITLEGTARSNPLVSNFMRRLGEEELFNDPELLVIQNEAINGVRASQFELMVRRAKLKDASAEEDESAADKG